jgi:hypothetical protein
MAIALSHKMLVDLFRVDQLKVLEEALEMQSPGMVFNRTGQHFEVAYSPTFPAGLTLCYGKGNQAKAWLTISPQVLEKALSVKQRSAPQA